MESHAAHGHDHGHAELAVDATPDAGQGQQHPLGIYFAIWFLLFVLSTFSYMIDYFQLHGILRWSLILIFMFLKAGLIVAVFMHMKWERLALIYAILIPPVLLTVLVGLMSMEADYTFWTRIIYFGFGTK